MVGFLFCSVVSRNDCKNYLFIFSGERRGDRTVLLQHLKVNNLSSDWRAVGSQRALLCQACDQSSKYFAHHLTTPQSSRVSTDVRTFSLGAGVGSDVPMLSGCARLSAAVTESLVQSGSIRCCFTRTHSPPSPPAMGRMK